MFVENKEMYHFNNVEKRKDIWKVGNEIDNTKDYISDYWRNDLNFNGKVLTNLGDEISFVGFIDSYLENEQDKETYIKMLKTARNMLSNYSALQREMILEAVRKDFYPDIISRKNAIYLCDNNQIEYWRDNLKRNSEIDLFKVEVTGELFKSSDTLLPSRAESISKMYEQAKEYWAADLTDIDDVTCEYLFSGKIKVLEKM